MIFLIYLIGALLSYWYLTRGSEWEYRLLPWATILETTPRAVARVFSGLWPILWVVWGVAFLTHLIYHGMLPVFNRLDTKLRGHNAKGNSNRGRFRQR
jgi:hypothetical protein